MDIHVDSKTMKICLGVIVLAIVALLIFKAPISGLLTIGIFLLCPLMHIFMMKGMGHEQNHQPATKGKDGEVLKKA